MVNDEFIKGGIIMKKVLSLVALCFMLLLAACGGGQQATNETDTRSTDSAPAGDKPTAPNKFLKIGSGPMGSGWYPLTTILSEVYMNGFSNLNVSQLEGGSTSNLEALEINDIQLGINYTSNYADALEGVNGFDKKLKNIAGFASLYPVYQQIATLQENEDINKVEDIVDKHLFLGPKGGGGPVAFWKMMEEYGITEKTIEEAGGEISYGNYSDGASMLKDGIVDVFIGGGAPQITALTEIEMTKPVKVIPIDQEKLESIKTKGYGIASSDLPAGTYKGQEKAVPTYTLVTMLTVRKDLEEEYVYNLAKMFWENLKPFNEQLPQRAKFFSLDTAIDGIQPETLHPGAKKYYKEVGALK